MKKIYLEFLNDDKVIAKLKTETDDNLTSKTKYYNYIKLYSDLERLIICKNIYSTYRSDNLLTLKSDDDTIIILKNINNPIIMNKIDNILLKSFNNIFDRMLKEKYECIYLTASKNRSNIDMISSFPSSKDKQTIFVELELNERGSLTQKSKEELDIVCNSELRNWVRIFISNYKNDILKICYDNKLMTINNKCIIDLIKPKVDFMQNLYLKSLNREESYYEQFNDGKTSKFM